MQDDFLLGLFVVTLKRPSLWHRVGERRPAPMSHALYTPRLSLSPRKMRPEDAENVELGLTEKEVFSPAKEAPLGDGER